MTWATAAVQRRISFPLQRPVLEISALLITKWASFALEKTHFEKLPKSQMKCTTV